MDDLVTATTLDREGMEPWHLRMSFQMYDLEGSPTESGTLEEWWISPARHRSVVVRSSSPPRESRERGTRSRESFLLELLRDEAVHPIPSYQGVGGLIFTEATQKLGKTELSCIAVSMEPIKASQFADSRVPEYCAEPSSRVFRLEIKQKVFSAVRNRVEMFRGVAVGLDETILYGGRRAITGKIETLEAYQPEPDFPSGPDELHQLTLIPMFAKPIHRAPPDFPADAISSHLVAQAMVHVAIDKQGKVIYADVIAGSDPEFSEAARRSAEDWTFQPYMVDGVPVRIDTTLLFNLNTRQ